jgi:hypothetical protein
MNYSEILDAVKDLQLQATLCSDGNPGRASQLRRQADALQSILPIYSEVA